MTAAIVRRSAVYVLVCATLLACGGGGGDKGITPPPDNEPVDNSAKVTGLLTEISAGQAAASASVSAGGTAAPPAPATSDNAAVCVMDIPSQSFKCPTRTLPNGMSITGSFQLLDASGAPQPAFDTATTVAIRQVTDMSGTVQQPLITKDGPIPAQQTMTSHTEITMSGLRTSTRVHNGTGTMTNNIVAEGRDPATMSATNTFANISFTPPSAGGQPYPISGTITTDITSKSGDQPQVTTHQVTTYDGTKIATLVITLPNGAKRTCTYDMSAAPGSSPPNCTGP